MKTSLEPRSHWHITLWERMELLHALVLEERRAGSNLAAKAKVCQEQRLTLSSETWTRLHPKSCGTSDIARMPRVSLVTSNGTTDLIRHLNFSLGLYALKYILEDKNCCPGFQPLLMLLKLNDKMCYAGTENNTEKY